MAYISPSEIQNHFFMHHKADCLPLCSKICCTERISPIATGQLSAVFCIGRTEPLLQKKNSLPERMSYKNSSLWWVIWDSRDGLFPHKQSAGSWIQPPQVTQPKETNIYRQAKHSHSVSHDRSSYSLQKGAKRKTVQPWLCCSKGKLKWEAELQTGALGGAPDCALLGSTTLEEKKGVSKGKAEQRGRGKKEKPSSEIRDVHGASHTQGKGCREAPEPLVMEWGKGLGLEPSPFPEAVDLGEALDMESFLPWDGSSLWGGAVGKRRKCRSM